MFSFVFVNPEKI